MSCESEFRSCEEGLNSNVINGGYSKDSRISYTREFLLSIAHSDASKKLPPGFDRSIFSELNAACNSAPEDHKLSQLEWFGKIYGDASRESTERRGFCTLSSKDGKPIYSAKPFSNKSQHSWQKPGNASGVGSLQNIEQDGILGSFSKLPSAESEVSTSKLQGNDSCLLSRCNQPYRPPCFYKAMNHSGTPNHDHSSKETECPRKERSTEGSWRKDTCVGLEENSPDTPPISPADSASIEHPYSSGEASEWNLTEESSASCPLVQSSSHSQLVQLNSGVVIDDVEELQGQILEGGRFSALISLEEAEDVDAYFLDEENLASSDSSTDIQNVKESNVGVKILEKKELRSHAANSAKSEETKIDVGPQVNVMVASNTSSIDLSIRSSAVQPSDKAFNSQLDFVAKDWKGIDTAAKELHKADAQLTMSSDRSEVRVPEFSYYTKNNDNIVNGRGSCNSGSRFIHRFPENDDSDCNISSEVDEEGWMVWGVTTGKSMKENLSGQGKPQEASADNQNTTFYKKTRFDVSSLYLDGISRHSRKVQEQKLDKTVGNQDLDLFLGEVSGFQTPEQADLSLELKLPDEDSLITIDDTYIFEQDTPKPSRGRSHSLVSDSKKSMRSESFQNFSLVDPWFHESEMNSRSSLVNTSVPLTHVNSPWKFYSNDYTPIFPMVPPRSVRPLKPHIHEPSDDYCPELDKILSADPSMYHEFLHIPCSNQEPDVLRKVPLNYPTTAKSIDVEKRGLLAEKVNNSTFNQFLQMQRKLVQMNIEAEEQRIYQTASNCFW